MNLKGKVISINEKEIKSPSVIAEGGEFNSRVETTFYSFNKNGFITEKTNATDNKFNTKEKFYYNTLNQISKFESFDEEGKLKDYASGQNEYDKNGEISRRFDETSSSLYKSELVKSPNSDLITSYYLENGVYIKSWEKTKNKKGQSIEDKSYAHDRLYSETASTYNNNGFLSQYVYKEYWNGNVTYRSQKYIYNKNNDAVKIISLDKDNNEIDEENFSYTYDKTGNWISKQTSGNYIITTTREIKYEAK
jgi:hypothetical protein